MPTFLLPTICFVLYSYLCVYILSLLYSEIVARERKKEKNENFLNTKTCVFGWGIFLTFCFFVLETDLQIMDLSCSNADENNVATSNIIS